MKFPEIISLRPIKNGWDGTWFRLTLLAVFWSHRSRISSDLTKKSWTSGKRGIPKNGGDSFKREKNVERVRSPEIRSKLIYLNNLVSINSDTAEQTLSVILKFSLDSWASRPPSGGERARSARQSGASLRLMLLAEWGSWLVFGSQLRLSKSGDSSPF